MGVDTLGQPPLRVSLLTNMVAPYRVPFFKAMAQAPEVKWLRVLTCVERESDRQWQVTNDDSYRVKQLGGVTLNIPRGDAVRILHLRWGIFWELVWNRPDRLIIGDASWTSYLAMVACLILRVPYVVWNEITTSSDVSGGTVARLRRALYTYARSCVASGKLARDFLVQEGCRPSKIFIANNAVDNDYYLAQRRRWEPERERLRRELAIESDEFALLFVGQLISRKRVMETLEAAAEVAEHIPLRLLIAGSGPLEGKLRDRAKELSFDRALFCGHVVPDRLCQLYVACDGVSLLSEDEPWGMVVNEALLFQRPVLVANCVGAAELIDESNGIAVATDLKDVQLAITHLTAIGSKKKSINADLGASPQGMAERFIGAVRV